MIVCACFSSRPCLEKANEIPLREAAADGSTQLSSGVSPSAASPLRKSASDLLR